MREADRIAVGRRVVLGMAAVGAVGIVAGETIQRWVGGALNSAGGGSSLVSLLPGANRFRYYTVTGSFPSEPDANYRLAVTGAVARPLSLSLADLAAMPRTSLVRDFQCVTRWRVPHVRWAGVQLSHILDAAGVQPGARALSFESFDGVYTESLTLSQAARPDVIVADRIEGGPIGSAHGGPARLYVAPMYGYKSCKWLSAIRVVDQVEPGYWEQLGYDVDAWVGQSNGRHDAPTS